MLEKLDQRPETDDGSGEARSGLVGLSRAEFEAAITALDLPAFRAKQVWHWIYHRGATDFDRMTTLAKPLRQRLAERFVIGRPAIAREQKSADGARKWLVAFADGREAETVHIP